MIRFALHLRYTSLQAYKLLLEKFPLPSISLLNNIQQGGVDSLKALVVLREKGEISMNLILMFDEMYLQKAAQYQAGEYVGADEEDNLYKGIVAFMVVGIKKSVPFVVQAIPEVTFDGQWLCDNIAENIKNLANAGFCSWNRTRQPLIKCQRFQFIENSFQFRYVTLFRTSRQPW